MTWQGESLSKGALEELGWRLSWVGEGGGGLGEGGSPWNIMHMNVSQDKFNFISM